ncbi:MAG: hypothetical protein Q8N55_04340 [bacterium]|nr:hypothetical protein [bacterium]
MAYFATINNLWKNCCVSFVANASTGWHANRGHNKTKVFLIKLKWLIGKITNKPFFIELKGFLSYA